MGPAPRPSVRRPRPCVDRAPRCAPARSHGPAGHRLIAEGGASHGAAQGRGGGLRRTNREPSAPPQPMAIPRRSPSPRLKAAGELEASPAGSRFGPASWASAGGLGGAVVLRSRLLLVLSLDWLGDCG
jgi:hypothetical protein